MIWILDFFRAIRIGNLLIIAIAQLLLIYKLEGSFISLSDDFALIFFTSLVVVFGNLENNILDYNLDRECKKKPSNKFVELFLNNHWLRILECACLLGLAFATLLIIDKLIILIAFALLKLYNFWAKRVAVVGNLIIATLCALTIFIIDIGPLALKYALIIGLYTLIREMIKDKEDEECDRKFGFRTLPLLIEDRSFRFFMIGLIFVVQIGLLYTTLFDSWLFVAIISCSVLLISYVYRGMWTIASRAMKALMVIGVFSLLG